MHSSCPCMYAVVQKEKRVDINDMRFHKISGKTGTWYADFILYNNAICYYNTPCCEIAFFKYSGVIIALFYTQSVYSFGSFWLLFSFVAVF